MDHYSNYQQLQTLLRDPKFQPYLNLAKKVLFYSSHYLIILLQTMQTFVSKHPYISEWIGYCFSLYMVYLTVKRTIRFIKSSLYLILIILALWIWQRGASQTLLMDIPYVVDRMRQFMHQLPRNPAHPLYFELAAPFIEIYDAVRSLF